MSDDGRVRGRGRGRGSRGSSPGGGPAHRGGGQGPPPGGYPGQGNNPSRGGGPGGPPPPGGYPGRGGRGFAPRGGGAGRGAGGAPEIFNQGPVVLADRFSKENQDGLISSFGQQPKLTEMPLRPGWGTKGKVVAIRTNYFPVQLPQGLIIYDYEIKYEQRDVPKGGKKKAPAGEEKKQLLRLLEGQDSFRPYLTTVAHDWSNRLVSRNLLPEDLSFDIVYYPEELNAPRTGAPTFHISFELKAELDTSDLSRATEGDVAYRHSASDTLPVLSALNLIAQQFASRHGTRVGRGRYFFANQNSDFHLGRGLFARQGFFLSLKPTFKQLMINVNVCMTTFYEPGNLAEAFLRCQDRAGQMPDKFGEGIKVITTHRGYRKKYTIKRVASLSARKQTFRLDGSGESVTVEGFFKSEYKMNLAHADDVPVVDVAPRNALKPIYIPAEICEIPPNQSYHGILAKELASEMIKRACNTPAVNANTIIGQGFPALGFQQGRHAGALQGFDMLISDQMVAAQARVLDPPTVTYRSGRPRVQNGAWNIMDVKFISGGNMQNWAVLLVSDTGRDEFLGPADPLLRAFINTFKAKCINIGMAVPPADPRIAITPRLPNIQRDPSRTQGINLVQGKLRELMNPRPSFVLVLLSGIDNFIYPSIKKLCDTELGVHTVTMLLNKARGNPNKQDQYFSNVALKVNIKLGGVDHLLDPQTMAPWKKKKTMMVGIDVTHPSPLSRKGTPSIVAVVASVDDNFVQFPTDLRLQRNPRIDRQAEEMVQELDQCMVTRLNLYKKKNGALPERVYVFRDGVSDGQFPLVLIHELPKIQAAFNKFSVGGKAYKPTLSIIVCVKRHQKRDYPTDVANATNNGNNPPGTAHHGLQGHARPTHYTAIYDENNFSADELQELTNRMSYLYARATKSVSLIPPAYYADLACERARLYLNQLLNMGEQSDRESTVSSQAGTKGKGKGKGKEERRGKTKDDILAEREAVFQESMRAWREVHVHLKETMFYI